MAIDINDGKTLSILDCSEEAIQKYLARTGQTREQVEAKLKAYKQYNTEPIEGADPALEDYFTQNPGYEVVE